MWGYQLHRWHCVTHAEVGIEKGFVKPHTPLTPWIIIEHMCITNMQIKYKHIANVDIMLRMSHIFMMLHMSVAIFCILYIHVFFMHVHVHTVHAALQINEHFLPMAMRYMAGGVAPVREAAADAVVVFMRHNRKQAQRTDIYCKLLREYARAKSHWRRMTFIDACHHVVRRFSTK